MSLETKHDLNEATVKELQSLIRACIDSYDGFHESAEELDDPRLKMAFKELGDQRSAMASELQQLVEFNGEKAENDGSVAAKTHRVWINIRSKLSSGETQAILEEAERGEDYIKAAYEDVLKATAGSAVNDLLTEQYTQMKAGHDKIRDVRDAGRSK
ncbi:PA2169 family four-helix-bundle protein [Roseiconus lacunae]|uniref:PA2169 family four-helix-bundle protein n=1 Tax=Roseiconus lacunae TaxID=2605694 RepID=UPI0011F3B28F|nr:PA2169 family four-helix-bundle protein [Roseiconus lacunae]